jgi:hypothetical protein
MGAVLKIGPVDHGQPMAFAEFRYRRHSKRRRAPLELRYGDVYTTKRLPGFTLKVDPRS